MEIYQSSKFESSDQSFKNQIDKELEQNIAIKSQNVLCGLQNKFINAYIFIKNQKYDTIIENIPNNQNQIKKYLLLNKPRIFDFNAQYILPGIIDTNCSLYFTNQDDDQIKQLTYSAVSGGITTLIDQERMLYTKNKIDLQTKQKVMKQSSMCDIGYVLQINNKNFQQIQKQSSQILGARIQLTSQGVYDDDIIQNTGELFNCLQFIIEQCSQISIFIQPSKSLEKDMAVTSPFRGRNPEDRIIYEDKFYFSSPQADGIQGQITQKDLIQEQYQSKEEKEIKFMKQFTKLSQEVIENHIQWISISEEMSYQKESQDEPELSETIKNLHEKLNLEYPEEFNVQYNNNELNEIKPIQTKNPIKFYRKSDKDLMRIMEESKLIQPNSGQFDQIAEQNDQINFDQEINEKSPQEIQIPISNYKIVRDENIKKFQKKEQKVDQIQIKNINGDMDDPVFDEALEIPSKQNIIRNKVQSDDFLNNVVSENVDRLKSRSHFFQFNSSKDMVNESSRISPIKGRKKSLSIKIRSRQSSQISENSLEFFESKKSYKFLYKQQYINYISFRPPFWEHIGINFVLEALLKINEKLKQIKSNIIFQNVASCLSISKLYKIKNYLNQMKISVEVSTPYFYFYNTNNLVINDQRFKGEPALQSLNNIQLLFSALLNSSAIDLVGSYNIPVYKEYKLLCQPQNYESMNRSVGGFLSIGSNLITLWTIYWINKLIQIQKYSKVYTFEQLQDLRKNYIEDGLIKFSEKLSGKPAQILGINNQKGYIKPGLDADFIVFNPFAQGVYQTGLDQDGEYYDCSMHIFQDQKVYGKVGSTFIRGQQVYDSNKSKSVQINNKYFQAKIITRINE